MSDGTYISRCFRCQAPNDAWGAIYCGACRQVDALEKSSKRAAELAEEQASQAARRAEQTARMQEEQHYESMRLAEENAALARQQAKENARLAAEGGVSYDDAYQYGLHYFETESGFLCFNRTITEEGEIKVARYHDFTPYKMAHLNQAFDRGIKDSIKDIVGPGAEYMEHCAFNAGFALEDTFNINSEVTIGDYEPRLCLGSKITRVVDTTTGFVKYTWNNPFKSKRLNDAYASGVDQKINELNENSKENVAVRMETEVVEILAEQARVAEEQRVAEENARVQQEQQAVANAKAHAERERIKGIRLFIALGIVLAIIGFIIGLWVTDHGVLSVLALLVTLWSTFAFAGDALINYIDYQGN